MKTDKALLTEYNSAIKMLHEALGIRGKLPERYVTDVLVDVRELGSICQLANHSSRMEVPDCGA